MRTNLAGLALTVGMGLLIVLLGFSALSAAGLVSFAPEALAEQVLPTGMESSTLATDSVAAVPVAAKDSAIVGDVAAIASGDALFKSNCTQCHAVNEKVVGPALAGIAKRRPLTWIVPWVQNSAKVVASGDEYAVKLFSDNGKQQMPSFSLTKKEVEDIVAWVSSQEGRSVMIDDSSLFAKAE